MSCSMKRLATALAAAVASFCRWLSSVSCRRYSCGTWFMTDRWMLDRLLRVLPRMISWSWSAAHQATFTVVCYTAVVVFESAQCQMRLMFTMRSGPLGLVID